MLTDAVVYLSSSDRLQWLRGTDVDAQIGSQGDLAAQLQPPAAPTTDAGAVAVTAIVPAEAALITAVSVPSSKPRHIRAAVPHLVEEWAAAELDQLHIAIGERNANGHVPVAAIDRTRLQNWLGTLQGGGVICRRAFVDAQLLPWESSALTILVDDNRALIRWQVHNAGALALDNVALFLELLLEQAEADTYRRCHLIRTAAAPAVDSELLTQWTRILQAAAVNVDSAALDEPLLCYLRAQLQTEGAAPLDLLQGDFAIQHAARRHWLRWRAAVWIAGAVLAAQLLMNLAVGLASEYRAQNVRAQSEELYRQLFPQDKRLVNLRSQMQNHLDVAVNGRQSPFLVMFTQLAHAISALKEQHPLQLKILIFDATSASLQVEVGAGSVEAIDTLQKRLSADGLTTRIVSAANEDKAFVGRLNLSSRTP